MQEDDNHGVSLRLLKVLFVNIKKLLFVSGGNTTAQMHFWGGTAEEWRLCLILLVLLHSH